MLADCCPECGVSGLTGRCLLRSAGCLCNAAAAPIPSAATVAQLLRAAHPVPQVPLMRSPDGTQLLCTNCGRDTTTAGAANTAESGPTEAPTAAPQPVQANGTGGHADSSSDDEGLLQPPPPLRSRLQAAAAPDGAAPPQQAARPAASALQQLPVPAPGPEARAARTAAQAPSERPGSSSSSQEASKAIAELMLEGWAMLQEHCPRCGTRREAQAGSCVAGRDASCVCCACATLCCDRPARPADILPALLPQVPQPAAAVPRPPMHLLRRVPAGRGARGRAAGGSSHRPARCSSGRGACWGLHKQPRSGAAASCSSREQHRCVRRLCSGPAATWSSSRCGRCSRRCPAIGCHRGLAGRGGRQGGAAAWRGAAVCGGAASPGGCACCFGHAQRHPLNPSGCQVRVVGGQGQQCPTLRYQAAARLPLAAPWLLPARYLSAAARLCYTRKRNSSI